MYFGNVALLVRAPDRSGALFDVVGCFGGGGGGVIYPSLIVNKQMLVKYLKRL